MEALFTTASQRIATPFTLQKSVVYSLSVQMSNWEEEANFYHRLLIWCLLSCKEKDRPDIEVLIAQLDELLASYRATLKEGATCAPVNPSGTTEIRDLFYYFDQRLQQLKAKVFHDFPKFGRVQIW